VCPEAKSQWICRHRPQGRPRSSSPFATPPRACVSDRMTTPFSTRRYAIALQSRVFVKARARNTARSPVLRPRHQNRNPMRVATTSLRHPLAGALRSRRRATVIPATANSHATPRAVPKSRCRAQRRRPIRDRQRQFALNDAGQRLSRPSRCPIKSP